MVLTGYNNEGTNGMKRIKEYGGLTVVQDPATAETSQMPASAIAAVEVDYMIVTVRSLINANGKSN
jgi:two-component system chemotaxis response regulator CheB